MTFPQATLFSGNSGANVTSYPIALPDNLVTGDVIIISVCKDGTGVITFPASPAWTTLHATSNSTMRMETKWRKVDGTEGWGGTGNSITVTGASEGYTHALAKIEAASMFATNPVTAGTAVSGTSINPNPGVLDPAGWATEDTLWIVAYGWDGNTAHSAYPANYTIDQITDRWANANGSGIAMATRENTVASEDPGTATLAASEEWVAITIAVRPTSAVTLTIDNLTQAQTLESFAFTQEHVLAVDNLTQAQTLDNLTITGGAIDLVIADLTQAQTLDSPTFTQIHELVIADLTQAQNLDNLALTQVHQLVIAALTQAQSLDSPTLTQVHQLVIAALTQAQNLDNLTVTTGAIDLIINNLTQAQTLDSPALTQVHQLAIDALTQAQNLDSLALTQVHQLAIDALTQAQTLTTLTLTTAGALRPTIDVVAVALVRALTGLPATRVDTTLPKDTVVWSDGFIQTVGVGEQSGMYVPLHSSVIAVSCWATNIGSGKPPWGKANQLAETIKVECLDHSNFPITLDLTPFGAYGPARVHSAYFVSEPHRIPSDEGSFARYDGDLQIHWTPL